MAVVVIGMLEIIFRHDAVARGRGVAAEPEIALIKLVRGAAQAQARPVAVERLVAATAMAWLTMLLLVVVWSPSASAHLLSLFE